jgi:hypothetical protein
MGARGPVGKRTEERMGHRSKAERAGVGTKVTVDAPLVKQPPPDNGWHPIAHSWYTSLAASGQCRFFEPSDWTAARLLAEVMTRNLASENRFSSQLFAAVWAGMNDLLTTEGSRRRVKLELERTGSEKSTQAASNLAVVADYRKRIA